MANHSSLLAWKIPRTEEPGGASVHGATKSTVHRGTTEQLTLSKFICWLKSQTPVPQHVTLLEINIIGLKYAVIVGSDPIVLVSLYKGRIWRQS